MARSNPALKKANTEMEYTPEQIQELRKCANDPIHFIKKYVMIQHPTQGTVPFDLFDYQEEMVEAYHKCRYSITLSARQTGKCVSGDTIITVIDKPTYLKKWVLWLVDNKQYRNIFT